MGLFVSGVAALVAASLLGAVSPATAAPGRCDPDFEVVAHRGHSTRDENTLPAVRLAAQRGYAVEVDVRATSDRRLILMHDKTFDRTTTGSGLVAETTFARARTYRTEDRGELIPTLNGALRVASRFDVDVYLDVKEKADAVLLAVAATVRRRAMVDRVLVTSWNGKMRQLAPRIARQWKPDGPAPTLDQALARDVDSVGLFRRQMSQSPDLVRDLRANGMEVNSRLVSGTDEWDAVTAYPIMGALTNRPNQLAAYCTPRRGG